MATKNIYTRYNTYIEDLRASALAILWVWMTASYLPRGIYFLVRILGQYLGILRRTITLVYIFIVFTVLKWVQPHR
jgi:hypothetical protein